MRDMAGRDLKEGQTVDICLQGMFHATVVGVRELPTMVNPTQMAPPQIIIQVIIPMTAEPNGTVEGVYVVRQADEKKPNLTLVQ